MDSKTLKDLFEKHTKEEALEKFESIIKKKSTTETANIFNEMFLFKDYCAVLFVLLNTNSKYIDVNFFNLNTFNEFLIKIKSDERMKKIDLTLLKDIFIKNIDASKTKTELYIETASNFNLSDTDIDILRKNFGYKTIFNLYKTTCDQILTKRISYDFLKTLIRTVNSEKICFNTLLPVYNHLSETIKNDNFDKNIVNSAIAIRTISKYAPSVLNKSSSSAAFLTFFYGVLEDTRNYRFLSILDVLHINHTIVNLIQVHKVHNKEDLFYGFFKTTFNNIKRVSLMSILFEELHYVKTAMCLLNEFYDVCYSLGIRKFDYKVLFNFISSLQLNIIEVESIDADNLIELFLIEKYRFLNKIKGSYSEKKRFFSLSTTNIDKKREEENEKTNEILNKCIKDDLILYKSRNIAFKFLGEIKNFGLKVDNKSLVPKEDCSPFYLALMSNRKNFEPKIYERFVTDYIKHNKCDLFLYNYTTAIVNNDVDTSAKILGTIMVTKNTSNYTKTRKEILIKHLLNKKEEDI